MPELPEVETVARTLREGKYPLVGRRIETVQVLWPREVHTHSPEELASRLAGARIESVGRHGKYLAIRLSTGDTMLVHLKMSGRLDVVPAADAFSKHARVVWLLDHDLALRFDDARKFGRVFLTDHPDYLIGLLSHVGPDALTLSEDEFVERLRRKKGALKPILLDQGFMAGVGNIYADESLFRAKLHPQRSAASLSDADARRLYRAVQEVLAEGILANGASFDWVYPDGNFQENFKVYGQTGKPCVVCGTPIQRILVGQRSTHFCPTCQPPTANG